MEFQEYPKALYQKGDAGAEHVIVADAREEANKRKAGFKMLGETEGEDKPKAKSGKQSEGKPQEDGVQPPQGDQQPQGDKAPE
jgi:hypothetical protein